MKAGDDMCLGLTKDNFATGFFDKDGREILIGDTLEYCQSKRQFIVYWNEEILDYAARFLDKPERISDRLSGYEIELAVILDKKAGVT